MTEQLQREDQSGGSNFLMSDGNSFDQRVSGVSNHTNGLHHANSKSDSVVLNMERFSHLLDNDIIANSRIALQRNLSRTGSMKVTEKKTSVKDKDANIIATSPPRTALHDGISMHEKPAVGAVGDMDQATVPQAHHQVIVGNPGAANADSKLGGKRFSFRRASHAGIINPRRIVFLFATLSCMGTVILIYFTLSMGKMSANDNLSTDGRDTHNSPSRHHNNVWT